MRISLDWLKTLIPTDKPAAEIGALLTGSGLEVESLEELESKIGKDAEIYRCEFCKTLYKPDPKQMPHSFTLRY